MSWIQSYRNPILEKIQNVLPFPSTILGIVVDYGFHTTIRLRHSTNLNEFQLTTVTERPPVDDIILELSDPLCDFVRVISRRTPLKMAYQRFVKRIFKQWEGRNHVPQAWRSHYFLAFDGVAENSQVDLSLPNLHRQLGEALHGMGVTWDQLQARVFVVNYK